MMGNTGRGIHRFFWLAFFLLLVPSASAVHAQEMRFCYFAINVGTLVPVTREKICEYGAPVACQGILDEPTANALQAFIKPLVAATELFDELNVRILITGPGFALAVDTTRHMQIDREAGSATYSLTETQLRYLLTTLKSHPAAKDCIRYPDI